MQKVNKYITVALIVIGTTASVSCKKYFDLDTNPNFVTDPPLPTMLTTATSKAGLNSYNVGSAVAPYVQYIANPTASAATDTYQQVDFGGTWDALYFALADLTDMKAKAIAQNSSEYIGVADVLLSYQISMVNDLWGAGPFSDAFNPKVLAPKFDTDQQLYSTSVTLINEAITQLAKTDAVIKLPTTGADFIHNGSRVAWLKTAYALKARLLNKLTKTSTYDPAAVLTALSSAYTSNADDAGMASFQTRNPWASIAIANAGNTLGGWLSEQLIDAMNGTTYGVFDPRVRKITDPTVNNVFVGTTNGAGNKGPANNTVKDECYVSQNSPWTSATAPLLLITYAETKFIEAEANLRINTPASRTAAYAAYLAGINANMDKLQVPAAVTTPVPNERAVYLASPTVAVGAAALTLDLIFKEKYIATYLNPEAWNDARRYDYKYKDFTLPVNAVLTDYIRRLAYPTSERSKNGANVPAAVPLTDRIFWDK